MNDYKRINVSKADEGNYWKESGRNCKRFHNKDSEVSNINNLNRTFGQTLSQIKKIHKLFNSAKSHKYKINSEGENIKDDKSKSRNFTSEFIQSDYELTDNDNLNHCLDYQRETYGCLIRTLSFWEHFICK